MVRKCIRHLRSNCCWPAGKFSSSTNMESSERLVLYDQGGNGNGLRDGLLSHLAIPFAEDFIPRHAVFKLFQHDPNHDASALERRLAAANLRICDDMPSQLNSVALPICFRFHADAPYYAPAPTRLQAGG